MALAEELAHEAGVSISASEGTSLIAGSDAATFLDHCESRRVRVLGIEGFGRRGAELVPDMDAILDLSGVADPQRSVVECRSFLGQLDPDVPVLDFVLSSEEQK